jgi:hypothetical protein
MKKLYYYAALTALLLIFMGSIFQKAQELNNFKTTKTIVSEEKRQEFESFLRTHEYKRRLTSEELDKIPKTDRPDLAFEQNFLATLDPNTGKPEMERLFPIMEMTKKRQQSVARVPGSMANPWVERGPDNVAGRTRALAWDPISTNKVWAGGVSGGLWYNNNITSATSSWQAVNDFWDNIAVTAIVFDPNDDSTIYVATGERYARANRGAGIWKSTDLGASFVRLTSTSSFYYIDDMVVRNESGTSVIYAAVSVSYYSGAWHGSDEGLQRSTNGGASWTQVLPNVSGAALRVSDLDIAGDNKLWVGTGKNSYGDGGGRIYSSSNGTSFSLKYTHANNSRRVSLACAPSNSSYVYALFEFSGELDAIKKTTNGGTLWTTLTEPNDADPGIPSTDFTRGQAWYDLIIDVDPLNMNNVIIGGIDLFKSSNGGTSWAQFTHWYGGFTYTEIHADQHAIVYKPGSSSRVIFGNDGGVAYSSSANLATPSISHRNKDYNVTQYYACAIHPTAGSNVFLAGAQDNGTQQYSSSGMNSTIEATGGDGAYCHIDQTNGNYQSAQYVYNVIRHTTNNFASKSTIVNDQNTGNFINASDLDDNMNILYSYKTQTSLYRITGFQSASPVVGTLVISDINADGSCLKVSPYTTTSTTLFVGTEAGRLYKITNANTTKTQTEITGSGFPTGSISCIEFGQTENDIIVTFSNYGVNSVWFSNNGGTSWVSKEGTLPDMPVRWALFNPLNYDEVILATEVGVWSTSNFNTTSPTWTASNSGLANVRVDMLQTRTSDNEVIAATHGRGLFSSNGFTSGGSNPTYCVATSTQSPCDEYISNVTMGTINNSTTCGNYTDFTTQTNDVQQGTSVAMTITTAIVGGANAGYLDDQVAVWVDWNNDNDFSDSGEDVYVVTYSSSTVIPLSFNVAVPANATVGNVRMRVRMSHLQVDGPITPCGNSQWGEVEDYTLNVLVPSTITWTSQPGTKNIECDDSIDPSATGLPTASSTCLVGVVNVSYSDNKVVGACANEWVITRRWTATDGCGATDSYNQMINATDNTNPTITCPSNQDLASSNGTGAVIPDYTSMATVSDNCSATSSVTVTQSPAIGNTVSLGVNTVTLTATDECGNSSTCTFDVDVQFNTGVSDVLFADITIYPNPTEGEITIDLASYKSEVIAIKVYSLLGEVVFFTEDLDGKQFQTINLENVSTGVLLIEIRTNEQAVIKRILKL